MAGSVGMTVAASHHAATKTPAEIPSRTRDLMTSLLLGQTKAMA